MQGPKVTSQAKLDGKTVVITGSNTGIGRTTALDMSRRGAKVVMLCRDMEKAEKAAEEIREATKGEVIVHKLDLADLASVRECAEQLGNSLEKIDILINNAGIMACPKMKTKDGFEMQFGTNHLGHFLLTELLMPLLHTSSASGFTPRIIIVSSIQHEKGYINWADVQFEKDPEKYKGFTAYNQSKLANVMHAKALARKHKTEGIKVYVLHPGVIGTDIVRNMQENMKVLNTLYSWFGWLYRFVVKTPYNGAQTTIYCALEKRLEEKSGMYFSDCNEKEPNPVSKKVEEQEKLWRLSEKAVGLNSQTSNKGMLYKS